MWLVKISNPHLQSGSKLAIGKSSPLQRTRLTSPLGVLQPQHLCLLLRLRQLSLQHRHLGRHMIYVMTRLYNIDVC